METLSVTSGCKCPSLNPCIFECRLNSTAAKADLTAGKHETLKFGLRPFTSPTQNLRAFH
jgi:hypothetical protein